jgi:hypothetical protein
MPTDAWTDFEGAHAEHREIVAPGLIASSKMKDAPHHEFKHDLGDLVMWKGIMCEIVGCSWDGEKESYALARAEPPAGYVDVEEITACP